MTNDIDSILTEYYEQLVHAFDEQNQSANKETLMSMIDEQHRPLKSLFKTLEF